MKKPKAILLAAGVLTLIFTSCSKSNNLATLQIRLTDAPSAFEEVNVEIREVQVSINDDSYLKDDDSLSNKGWISLETNNKDFNLQELQNGVSTNLAAAVVPSGIVREIRFVLGPNNTVKDNGEIYPLVIPAGGASGLKIKVDRKLNADFETLVIDFDAALSVKKEGNGDYKLRPVLKIK